MKPLTDKMCNLLRWLYDQTPEAYIAYPTDCHWKVIEGLWQRGLLERGIQYEGAKAVRYIAFTDKGLDYFQRAVVINDHAITTSRPQKSVALFFECNKLDHMAAYRHVVSLKQDKDFRPTMIDLLNMDRELAAGETALLEDLYPEAVKALHTQWEKQAQLEAVKQLQTLWQEMAQQRHNAPIPANSDQNQGAGQSVGLRGMGVAIIAPAPDFEDEDVELNVTSDENATQRVNANFLRSLGLLK